MKQDRFLLGILIFIGLLVIAALVLFFVRNQPPEYSTDDSPRGVLYNYAVALQLRDYERAYSYLADKDNKPTYDAFHQAFISRQLDTSTSALTIGDVQAEQNGEAWVNVTVEYAGSGLLNRGWSNPGQAVLEQQQGAWRITSLINPFWGWDWYQPVIAVPKD
jgi:hypothetical protein